MRLALYSVLVLAGAAAAGAVWLSKTPPEPAGVQVGLDFSQPNGIARTRAGAGSSQAAITPQRTASTPPTAGTPPPAGPADGAGGADTPDTGQRSVTVVPALVEKGPHGELPRISPDGRTAWRVYSRPFDRSDRRPRIAVIITDLGLKRDVTESAIEDLPGVVSLAFSPYGRDLAGLAVAARRAGHEVLIALPLETPPDSGTDPGPRALLASLPPDSNRDRLHWIMGRASAYVGLVAWPIGVFAGRDAALKLILDEARDRGIVVIDGRPADAAGGKSILARPGVVWGQVTVWLDRNPSPRAMEAAFRKAEQVAKKHGRAIVIGRPYPLTLTRVRGWLEGLAEKGLVAAPVTAVVRKGAK